MNQKKKILLVLYYQGPSTSEKISKMLGHCDSNIMGTMRTRNGWLNMDRKGRQGVRSLNEAGYNLAEMIKKDVSLWTYVKLCLGWRVR